MDKFLEKSLKVVGLIAGLSFLGILGFIGYFTVRTEIKRNRNNTPDAVKINQVTQARELLNLGGFKKIANSNFLIAPLSSHPEGSRLESYESSYAYRTANYLVFDIQKKEGFWLLEDNNSRILGLSEVVDQKSLPKDREVLGFALTVAQSSDNRTENKGKTAFYYFNLKTRKKLMVSSDFDRSIGIEQTSDREVLFFYAASGQGKVVSLDLSTEKISEAKSFDLAPH